MPPEDDKGPDYKPTAKLEQVPAWAIALTEKVTTGFARLGADIGVVANDVQVVKDRVVILEKWKLENEERVRSHSGGVRQLSTDNAKQDAAIALLHTKTDQQSEKLAVIEAKVEENTIFTKQAIAGFFKTPLGMAILGLAMAAAGYATNWLTAHGGH